MSAKWVLGEEEWMVFGKHPDGRVDVDRPHTGTLVFVAESAAVGEHIARAHNEALERAVGRREKMISGRMYEDAKAAMRNILDEANARLEALSQSYETIKAERTALRLHVLALEQQLSRALDASRAP